MTEPGARSPERSDEDRHPELDRLRPCRDRSQRGEGFQPRRRKKSVSDPDGTEGQLLGAFCHPSYQADVRLPAGDASVDGQQHAEVERLHRLSVWFPWSPRCLRSRLEHESDRAWSELCTGFEINHNLFSHADIVRIASSSQYPEHRRAFSEANDTHHIGRDVRKLRGCDVHHGEGRQFPSPGQTDGIEPGSVAAWAERRRRNQKGATCPAFRGAEDALSQRVVECTDCTLEPLRAPDGLGYDLAHIVTTAVAPEPPRLCVRPSSTPSTCL